MTGIARRGLILGAIASPAIATVARAAPAGRPPLRSYASLPDWSGVWRSADRMAGLVFDASGLKPGEGATSARNYPPFNAEWEARYTSFLERVVRAGKFADPLTVGLPPGFPRFVSLPRAYQFIVRPEAVWMTHERPDLRTIYTDGRGHPPEEILFATWSGHSIGHWEADTLVVHTVAMKPGVTLDRTGLVLSDQAYVVERVRKTAPGLIENEVTIHDPVAFTRPWVVRRRYAKITEPDPTVEDVPSLENDRNPIVNGETQTILNTDYDPDKPYPPNIQPFAAM